MIYFGHMDQGREAGRERRVAGRVKMCRGQRKGRPGAVGSDEIRDIIIDHAEKHGFSFREAGLRVQSPR